MKTLLILVAILLELGASGLAQGPSSSNGESQRACSLLFRHFTRALPESGRKPRQLTAFGGAKDLSTLVTDHEETSKPAKQGKSPPIVRQTDDGGHLIHFYSLSARSDPETYRKLKERLALVANLLEYDPENVSIVATNDRGEIRDFLETKRRVREPSYERKERAILCGFIGAPLFGFLGAWHSWRQWRHDEDAIVSHAAESRAGTLEKHLTWLRNLLADDPKRETKIEQHLEALQMRKAAGLPVPYGSREHTYGELALRYSDIPLEELNALAIENGVNRDTLHEEAETERPHVFSGDELEYVRGMKLTGPFGMAGEGLMSGIVMGGLGIFACSDEMLIKGASNAHLALSRVAALGGPAELRPLRDFMRANLKSPPSDSKAPQREALWLGANTRDGDHRDLFLLVNRRYNPPQLTLVGLSYKAPTDYLVPPQPKIEDAPPPEPEPLPPPPVIGPPKAVPAKPIELETLERRLNAKFFAGQKSRPREISELFERARALALSPSELGRFKEAVDAYEGGVDTRLIRYALDDIRRDRQQGRATP